MPRRSAQQAAPDGAGESDETMRTLDLNEAAEFLRLHPHTLEAKARAGEIPGAKPGKRWVFIDDDLADWLRAQYRTENPADAAPLHPTMKVAAGNAGGSSAAKRLEDLLTRKEKTPRSTSRKLMVRT